MRKYEQEIYYNPYQLPPRTFWRVDVGLTRSDAGKLCEGLHAVISDLTGASFYYPDVRAERTICRFEWQIAWGKKKFGIRLGIIFSISREDLKTLEVYATHGDESDRYGTAPEFSKEEISIFNNKIIKVIKEALKRSTPESKKPYHTIFYIELPPLCRIADPLELPEFGIIVFPTVILGKENKRVSAIAITVNESSPKAAKAVALQKIATVCALLTVASGGIYKSYNPEWPKNRKPIEFLNSIEPLATLESLYPYRRWQPCLDVVDEKFSGRLKTILTLYFTLPESKRTDFIDPIFAYYAGKELSNSQPTLSVVALLAALNSFVNVENCTGDVNCSICGVIKSENGMLFRHHLTGDRVALVNFLCEIFGLDKSSEIYHELNCLLTRLYREQRSAFVHGATLRHGEYHRDYSLPAALPTSEAPYSDLLLYSRDLKSLEPSVRRTLLTLLSKESGIPLDENLFGLGKLKIYSDIAFVGSITLPRKIKVYPFKENFEKTTR